MKQIKKKTFERKSENEIKYISRQLRTEYNKASKEMIAKYEKQMQSFIKTDELKKAQVATGELTQKAYMDWRKMALLNNERVKSLIQELSSYISNVNRTATELINGRTANVFKEYYNIQMYEIEKDARVITAFGIYNKNTVANLTVVPVAKNKLAKDLLWNSRKIHSALTQGILQGESIPKIARRLSTVAGMNKKAAIRNARTMITSAENKGRMMGMEYAESVGIKQKKVWIATLDDRTRDSHAILDGETIPVDEEFSNGLMFPADIESGEPEEVYNCRCTMQTVIDGVDFSVNPSEVTRASKLGDMSYEDWKRYHAEQYKNKIK